MSLSPIKSQNSVVLNAETSKQLLCLKERAIDSLILSISKSLSILIQNPGVSIQKNRSSLNYEKKDMQVPYLSPANHLTSTLENYLRRLVTYARLELEVLIAASVLIERHICCLSETTVLSSSKMLRLLAVSTFVAFKYVHDTEVWCLEDYSMIAGMTREGLKQLEIKFLKGINFRVYVSDVEFEAFTSKLIM